MELSVELLLEAIRSFPEPILIKNLDGEIQVGSKQAAEFLGVRFEDLPGGNLRDLLPPSVYESIRDRTASFANSLPTLSEENWEFEHDTRTVLVSRTPIHDAEGTYVGLIAGYRNLSPVKQAFALYEQNQQRFLTLAKTCPVGIFECNPYHQVTYVNAEWERITGIPLSDIFEKDWLQLIAPEHELRVRCIASPSSEPIPNNSVDCLVRGATPRWVELSINHCLHEDGNPVSYIGSMVDLTSRLAAQRELEEQVNLMCELTSSVPAIIWQMGMDGRCIFISDHWQVLTGCSTQEAIQIGWAAFVHPDDRSIVERNLTELRSNHEQNCNFECRLAGAAGDWRWTLVEGQQIHSVEGELRGIVGHAIDITERKLAQQELLQMNATLEQRVLDRTKALRESHESLRVEIESRRQIEEMLELKRSELDHVERLSLAGQLSGELAHELNQPLNAIQNYAGSLLHLASNLTGQESVMKIIGSLNKEIARAAKIIKRTRDFVSSGKLLPEQFDLCEIIADTAAMLKGESRRRGMNIQLEMDVASQGFLGDKVGLQQVLVNLVLNALESMIGCEDSEKSVVVEMKSTPDFITIAVHDTGSGVPSAEADKLFDAFFTTKPTGLGMGLAISRRIVESHNGTLKYEARAKKGSSFIIALPAKTN